MGTFPPFARLASVRDEDQFLLWSARLQDKLSYQPQKAFGGTTCRAQDKRRFDRDLVRKNAISKSDE
jgi:hypothetical protein